MARGKHMQFYESGEGKRFLDSEITDVATLQSRLETSAVIAFDAAVRPSPHTHKLLDVGLTFLPSVPKDATTRKFTSLKNFVDRFKPEIRFFRFADELQRGEKFRWGETEPIHDASSIVAAIQAMKNNTPNDLMLVVFAQGLELDVIARFLRGMAPLFSSWVDVQKISKEVEGPGVTQHRSLEATMAALTLYDYKNTNTHNSGNDAVRTLALLVSLVRLSTTGEQFTVGAPTKKRKHQKDELQPHSQGQGQSGSGATEITKVATPEHREIIDLVTPEPREIIELDTPEPKEVIELDSPEPREAVKPSSPRNAKRRKLQNEGPGALYELVGHSETKAFSSKAVPDQDDHEHHEPNARAYKYPYEGYRSRSTSPPPSDMRANIPKNGYSGIRQEQFCRGTTSKLESVPESNTGSVYTQNPYMGSVQASATETTHPGARQSRGNVEQHGGRPLNTKLGHGNYPSSPYLSPHVALITMRDGVCPSGELAEPYGRLWDVFGRYGPTAIGYLGHHNGGMSGEHERCRKCTRKIFVSFSDKHTLEEFIAFYNHREVDGGMALVKDVSKRKYELMTEEEYSKPYEP